MSDTVTRFASMGNPGLSVIDRLSGFNAWSGGCTGGVMRDASGDPVGIQHRAGPLGRLSSMITGVLGM